jgi:hypothetical protein
MYSHLKLTNQYLSEQDKKVLVEATLLLLIRKDISVTRRVNQWLFGKPDSENKYHIIETNRFVINYIIHGFLKIFSKVPIDTNSSTFPLKLLQNFYMEHEHMVEMLLPDVSFTVLNYVHK